MLIVPLKHKYDLSQHSNTLPLVSIKASGQRQSKLLALEVHDCYPLMHNLDYITEIVTYVLNLLFWFINIAHHSCHPESPLGCFIWHAIDNYRHYILDL